MFILKLLIWHTLTKKCGVFGERARQTDADVWHSVFVKREQRRQKIIGKRSLTVTGFIRRQNAVAQQNKPATVYRTSLCK